MTANSKSSTSKSTGRALLASFLALLLCFSTLLGTTFAWFTDSASTGVNTIKAGNLKMQVSAAKVSNGALGSFSVIDSDTPIFDSSILWEPNHTEVAYLKIENTGSLALKYQVAVSVLGTEKTGTSVLGNTYKLSDYLVASLVNLDNTEPTVYNSGTEAQAAAGSTQGITQLLGTGNLAAKNNNSEGSDGNEVSTTAADVSESANANSVQYYALIIYMPSSVGNEANGTGAEIELGINVEATQYTSEADSFGTTYDSDAKYAQDYEQTAITEEEKTSLISEFDSSKSSYTISTASGLMYLAELVNSGTDFSGKTITLQNNITLSGQWTPIGTSSYPFKGIFDGNGKTISGLYMYQNDGGQAAGLFGVVSDATITHVKVIGNITLASVQLGDNNSIYNAVAGICGYAKGVTTIAKCTNAVNINASSRTVTGDSNVYVAGILGYGKGTIKIENCLNEGNISGGENTYAGGIISMFFQAAGTTLTICNCLNVGQITVSGSDDGSSYAGAIAAALLNGFTVSGLYSTTGEVMYFAYDDDEDDETPENSNILSSGLTDTSSYLNFDFTDVWTMGSNYPVLK